MQTTTTQTTCPAWCVSTHTTSGALHYQDDTLIQPTAGSPLAVSAFADPSRGQAGVYLGSTELTPYAARQLAHALLERADLAEAAALAMDEADR